jgi:hypothetical protein
MAEVYGLAIDDLPEDWQPIEAVVLVKCIRPDADGNPYVLASRRTDGVTPWEIAGMAECLRHLTLVETFGSG